MKKRTTPTPFTEEQFVQAVKEITLRPLPQFRKKDGPHIAALTTGLRRLYRLTGGHGPHWQMAVSAFRKVGLVA